MLVDEGKLKWDEPATKYLPGFQLFDPYVTRELTVRDMLSHRSGLERGDLLWYGTEYDRDEVLRRVRFLKPSWECAKPLRYQNILPGGGPGGRYGYGQGGMFSCARESLRRWDVVIEQLDHCFEKRNEIGGPSREIR